MIVDVHAHYYPSDYLELIGATGVPHLPVAPLAVLDIDQRLALMDRIGVDTQVLSISATQPYLPDPGDAVEAARLANDRYAEVVAAHPTRFAAFAALPLPHLDESMAELRRCLDDLGMVGVTLGCSIAGHQLSDPLFDPLYAELDRRRSTIFVHPCGGGLLSEAFDRRGRLEVVVGFYLEDTLAAVQLAEAQVPSRFPSMKIIIPHLGGMAPMLVARLKRAAPQLLGELQRLYFDTLNDQPEVVACACEALGTERLVYGTDFPYANESEYAERLARLGRLGLPAHELAEVQGDRAARLLGLGS